MTDAVKFLTTFAQALATMSLYSEGHPARARGIEQAYERLQLLQETDPKPRFSFLGQDVVYGEVALRELGDAFAHGCDIAAEAGAGTLVWVRRYDLVEFAVVLEPD